MCTICGHFSHAEPIAATDIYDMLKKMAHRGPDMHGVYLDGSITRRKTVEEFKSLLKQKSRIAMGHSRLGIIGSEDLSQPYTSCDGKLTPDQKRRDLQLRSPKINASIYTSLCINQ